MRLFLLILEIIITYKNFDLIIQSLMRPQKVIQSILLLSGKITFKIYQDYIVLCFIYEDHEGEILNC